MNHVYNWYKITLKAGPKIVIVAEQYVTQTICQRVDRYLFLRDGRVVGMINIDEIQTIEIAANSN